MTQRYTLTRGTYIGTTDDRADRWYIEDADADTVDRRGGGYECKECAEYDVAHLNGEPPAIPCSLHG